jgi:hypothetical protein
MPNLRWSLSGTLMLLLIAVPTVMAADEPATTGSDPVVVSGTLDCDVEAAASPAADGSTVASTASILNLHEWAASDSRLSGEASYSGRWQLYAQPAEDSGSGASDAAAYAIVNDGGSWLCTETRTSDPPRTDGEPHTVVFTGQGDYEGYTAYLQVDFSQAPYAFSGLILEGDAPPYAEPQG